MTKTAEKNIVNDAIIKDVSSAIHNLDYGTMVITVHNSRIVQVEVTKKNRFDDVWHTEGGGI